MNAVSRKRLVPLNAAADAFGDDVLTLAHFPEIYVPVGAVLQRAVV